MNRDSDQGTQYLILQLLLEDVKDEIDRSEGQLLSKEATPPIHSLGQAESESVAALYIWKSEIESQVTILSDFQLATALSLEVETLEEPPPKGKESKEKWSFSKFISNTVQKLVNSFKKIMRSIRVLSPADSFKPVCSSCQETSNNIFQTKCSHFYCKSCLIRLFTTSLKDESMFPPRCCKKPIQGSGLKNMIGSALVEQHRTKNLEINDHNRTYCSNSRCSRYILPTVTFGTRFLTTVGTCKCGVRTCRKCKKPAHGGKCLYQLDKSIEKLMQRKGWQRCSRCGHVVELTTGCMHITCMCKAEWCYICGRKWKTCDCNTHLTERMFQIQNPSAKPLPLTIQELGYSLETAIDLTESTISEAWHECVSCREDQILSDMLKTQCSHYYCKNCLARTFTDSLRDESLFPPKCCQKPIRASERLLGTSLAQRSKEKAIELNDPDRTYCFDPKCSRYLPQMLTRHGACRCQTCGRRTCRKCKKRAHGGRCLHECDAMLEDLAKSEGWQRCSKCGRLIELRTGCNHITCVCKFEFCYCCTKRWKTCGCAYSDEVNLYERDA
ncbi:Zinc finger RING/FYVE/PHD-type [Penicillium paradoxum]|uniref:Zinc finger RING/FYVE/PHD-type n=1 Tax=Penicillium paradoxum TaxID=176176 RepID=UPI00254709E5|nr:Zinc finger RING/FYVE/PHD-type [Penicillium paradoxum]KAJ5773349.1 Zinc finger RING/FYVE/PHD-type [Penicillium paradoxum]